MRETELTLNKCCAGCQKVNFNFINLKRMSQKAEATGDSPRTTVSESGNSTKLVEKVTHFLKEKN